MSDHIDHIGQMYLQIYSKYGYGKFEYSETKYVYILVLVWFWTQSINNYNNILS